MLKGAIFGVGFNSSTLGHFVPVTTYFVNIFLGYEAWTKKLGLGRDPTASLRVKIMLII